MNADLRRFPLTQLEEGGYEPTTVPITLGRGVLLLHIIGDGHIIVPITLDQLSKRRSALTQLAGVSMNLLQFL
jgi:hypothetical protein